MKLFLIATLFAVGYAARLEHLEQQQQLRAYLPPSHGSGFGPHGSLGHNGAFGAAGAGQFDQGARASFPSASVQYLPPDHGPSAADSISAPDFAGSLNGFGVPTAPNQQFGGAPQYGHQASPNHFGHQDASPQGSSPFGAQAGLHQPSPASNQYLAPHAHSSQDLPQQPFDEQTGYHY